MPKIDKAVKEENTESANHTDPKETKPLESITPLPEALKSNEIKPLKDEKKITTNEKKPAVKETKK